MYLHEHENWTNFLWNSHVLLSLLSDVRFAQGELLGNINNLGFAIDENLELDAVSSEVVASSRIEGVDLDAAKVRSSVARQLGLDAYNRELDTRYVDGAVSVMIDAARNFAEPLSADRLFGWHNALFPTGFSGLRKIAVAEWRTSPMRVVSGAVGHERIHYVAPDAEQVPELMDRFISWFNEESVYPLLKAGIAHLWFLTIHPFEDGNGRIARALTEELLARSDQSPRRFYSMAGYIFDHRDEYYDALERAQKGTPDITAWLEWFLHALYESIQESKERISRSMQRSAWWRSIDGVSLNERQRSVLKRLLGDFKGKLTTSKWAKLCKVSSDTALRDINDLVAKGILVLDDKAGGRSASYVLADILSE